jgi:hypothetical protein
MWRESQAANVKVRRNSIGGTVKGNHRVSQQTVANEAAVSRERVKGVVADLVCQMYAQRVPRMLTKEMKQKRMDSGRPLLRYEREGDEFLCKIVTGDERWDRDVVLEYKRQ